MEMMVENGNVKISSEVIASIVNIAIEEAEGFSVATENFMKKMLQKNEREIKVVLEEDGGVSISVAVCIKYGLNIPKEAKKLQIDIADNIEIMTALNIKEVNIDIVSLSKEVVESK